MLGAANECGIHENTLTKWKQQYRINPEGAFNRDLVEDDASAQDRELHQLKRRVRALEEENDFLKRCQHAGIQLDPSDTDMKVSSLDSCSTPILSPCKPYRTY